MHELDDPADCDVGLSDLSPSCLCQGIKVLHSKHDIPHLGGVCLACSSSHPPIVHVSLHLKSYGCLRLSTLGRVARWLAAEMLPSK